MSQSTLLQNTDIVYYQHKLKTQTLMDILVCFICCINNRRCKMRKKEARAVDSHAWLGVECSGEVVHHSNVDVALSFANHIQDGIYVVCPSFWTEWWRGTLEDQNIRYIITNTNTEKQDKWQSSIVIPNRLTEK